MTGFVISLLRYTTVQAESDADVDLDPVTFKAVHMSGKSAFR